VTENNYGSAARGREESWISKVRLWERGMRWIVRLACMRHPGRRAGTSYLSCFNSESHGGQPLWEAWLRGRLEIEGFRAAAAGVLRFGCGMVCAAESRPVGQVISCEKVRGKVLISMMVRSSVESWRCRRGLNRVSCAPNEDMSNSRFCELCL